MCFRLFRSFSISIYRLLTNFFALFHRQVRLDADVLPKLTRWFIHDTTIRVKSKIPVNTLNRPDASISRAALQCSFFFLSMFFTFRLFSQVFNNCSTFIRIIYPKINTT